MGYYTKYALWHDGGNVLSDKNFDELEQHIFNTDEISWHLEDECKWYFHDKSMTKLSEEFPTVTFALQGTGEEDGDLWIKYYRNGKCVGGGAGEAIYIYPASDNEFLNMKLSEFFRLR